MTLTFIGILLLLIGLPIIFLGRTEAVLGLLLGCGILGGAAAVNLPALGGSSIPPIQFALMLGMIRIFLPGSGQAAPARAAVEANWPLLLYTAYGVAIAAIGPRLFRGDINLPALRRGSDSYIYAAQPLAPSAQNITTSVYLIGTLLCAVLVYAACSRPGGWRALVKTAVVVAWINIALGILVAVTKGTALGELFSLFRNGSYAQLEQEYRGFIRLAGLFPETSTYATYTFVWFCFMFECWYRDVLPRRTGPLTLAMFAILLASTSATAYVSLAAFTLIFAVRMAVPGAARSDKLVVVLLAALGGAVLGSAMFFLQPAMGAAFIEMLDHIVLGKSQSYSGLQRGFWARKGLEAFGVSHGIGVGPGSFRSSSLLTAILGSTGAIGMACVFIHVVRVTKLLHASTHRAVVDASTATGAAAGWAALMVLVPASLTLPSCDLGTDFAVLSGAALALRAMSARRRRDTPDAMHTVTRNRRFPHIQEPAR